MANSVPYHKLCLKLVVFLFMSIFYFLLLLYLIASICIVQTIDSGLKAFRRLICRPYKVLHQDKIFLLRLNYYICQVSSTHLLTITDNNSKYMYR